MEIQSLLPFEFKETLNKWKFLEKDPIREKQFIMLLRKYKQFTIILQKDLEQFSGFIIKINAENFLKEVKILRDEIEYFFEKNSIKMNEKEIIRLKEDLMLRLELLAEKFENLNKKKWFQENNSLAISCNDENSYMINNNEEIRNFSKSNSLSMSLPEKFSPELIRPLKKSNLSKTHHNEKNDKREKEMEIRSELEDQLLNLSKEMKDIAISYTGQLKNDSKALENIEKKQQKNMAQLHKGDNSITKFSKLTALSLCRLILMLLFSFLLFFFTCLIIFIF